MHRLHENKLIFGRLLTIREPHLVGRYNAALKAFGSRQTELSEFRIDMTGFSPEIADEFDDWQYLDPQGVNRRFIILLPQQSELPVVHTAFSNTEDLMNQFFQENARAILALTIKDVVFGEMEDSVFAVHDIDDLLSIEHVEFRVSTSQNLLGKTSDLKLMMDKLIEEPDAWKDEAMLKDMVSLAKVTGDIRTNELLPDKVVFRHDSFWSSHFGGIYIFNDENQITVVSDASAKGFRKSRPWTVSYLDIRDQGAVFDFLLETGRLDPPRGSWIEQTGLLEKRYRMKAISMMSKAGYSGNLADATMTTINQWVRENWDDVKRDGSLPAMFEVIKNAPNWSNVDLDDVDEQHRFLISRGNPEHRDRYLVNRLISDYLPFDYLTLFVFNKPGFYKLYETWPESFRDFVVDEIRNTYLNDKRAVRAKLYR